MSADQSHSYSGMSGELLAKAGAQIGDKIRVGVRKRGESRSKSMEYSCLEFIVGRKIT